ncbi:unnamed protein product [Rotaria sp. Silwood1]|nr:unnamed protein product [Rotaria sp. Silwood1]
MLPTNISILSDDLIGGPIPPGSTLDVFIRTQLVMRGGTIDAGRALTKLPLIEPIVLVDEFDTWYFDHLHGLFELNLVPQQQFFPRKWKLAPNVELYYLFEWLNDSMSTDQESAQTAKNVDRPSTVSLERFVEDVCEKENNGMAEEWIKALRTDHLFSYDHLVNLKYSEWDQLKQLPLNGRKILKSYVDREKQMATDTKGGTKDKKSDSNNDIRKQFLEVGVRPPAKLNAECVQLSFDEMRREGFADDGLFDQMKLFFLPLTMVEEDLAVNETRWKTISTRLLTERNNLVTRKQDLAIELNEKEDEYYRHDDAIRNLRYTHQSTIQKSDQARNNGSHKNSKDGGIFQRITQIVVGKTPTSSRNTREQTDYPIETPSLAKSKTRQNVYETFSTIELIQQHRQAMEELEPVREKLRNQIEAIQDLISSLDQSFRNEELNSDTKSDRDLIKPNRGFIMYGPPGTGKSDIMSKLSIRMGINMVAPPLAAGELNRPLVGESERIISDICMRCHRIPYLMCCVSIDEIDSLAPKRKDDTSDGNVAKLSVLLSVIDGIKDVPNLMIFCATNRLHMMDDAFLRRMSGKFFVGRPSSHARKSILSGIKSWHMPPNLLDSLTMATTNFSGAALR